MDTLEAQQILDEVINGFVNRRYPEFIPTQNEVRRWAELWTSLASDSYAHWVTFKTGELIHALNDLEALIVMTGTRPEASEVGRLVAAWAAVAVSEFQVNGRHSDGSIMMAIPPLSLDHSVHLPKPGESFPRRPSF